MYGTMSLQVSSRGARDDVRFATLSESDKFSSKHAARGHRAKI